MTHEETIRLLKLGLDQPAISTAGLKRLRKDLLAGVPIALDGEVVNEGGRDVTDGPYVDRASAKSVRPRR